MKNIKYRAWDTKRKKMWSPEEMGKDELTINPDGRGFVNVHGISIKLSGYLPHLVPLQFIGRLDENKKEIYEKDIVEYTCILGDGHSERWRDEVFYSDTDCAFLFGRKSLYSPSEVYDIKVIGNKLENPELLRGEQ